MEEKALDILVSICGVEDVREDLEINLFDSGLLDSLGLIELLVQIEEKLGIVIEPTEVNREEIETPKKLIGYLIKRG